MLDSIARSYNASKELRDALKSHLDLPQMILEHESIYHSSTTNIVTVSGLCRFADAISSELKDTELAAS